MRSTFFAREHRPSVNQESSRRKWCAPRSVLDSRNTVSVTMSTDQSVRYCSRGIVHCGGFHVECIV